MEGERNILIDAGRVRCRREIYFPPIAQLGPTLSDISLVLNTHGHFDHAADGNEGREWRPSIHPWG